MTTTYRYDALNRPTRKTSGSASVYFTYTTRGDNQSFVDTIRYPGNVNAYYTYDAANALSRVVHPTGTTTKYVRDALSRPQKVQFGNGTVCYYAFDNAERLSSIRHFTSTGKGIAYFDYQRDADARIAKIARENLSIYYGYDNVDRLTSEVWLNKGTGAQIYAFRYTYDAAGNRLKNYRERSPGGQIDTAYYKYDNANALVKRFVIPANATSYYRYDANGALVKIFDGTNATYFAYGPHQLITQITPPAADGQPWQFVYDGQLSRRKIVKAGTASYYLWNGMNQLEERDSAGALRARYTHGDPIVPGIGSIVEAQRITATTTYFQYLHMDHQGSVAKITDSSQNTQLSYVNDAFGRKMSNPTGSNTNVPNDLIFMSNWLSITVGTRQYGISPTRVYDYELGIFLSRDKKSIGLKTITTDSIGNGNLYAEKLNPNNLDPTGNSPFVLNPPPVPPPSEDAIHTVGFLKCKQLEASEPAGCQLYRVEFSNPVFYINYPFEGQWSWVIPIKCKFSCPGTCSWLLGNYEDVKNAIAIIPAVVI